MGRLRLLILITAVLVLGLLAFMAWRTHRSLAEQERLEVAQLADQVFDDCQRWLAMFATREQGRPFSHYGYHYVPEGMVDGAVSLHISPIAAWPPPEPIRTYYQREEGGEFTTPHNPGPQAQKLLGADPRAGEAAIACVSEAFRLRPDGGPGPSGPAEYAQVLESPEAQGQIRVQDGRYQYRSNLGQAKSSAPVKQKAPPEALYNYIQQNDNQESSNVILESVSGNRLQADDATGTERDQADAARAKVAQLDGIIAKHLGLRAEGEFDVDIGALTGVRRGDHYVLSRRATFGERRYEQGLILDTAALERTLEEELFPDPEVKRHVALHWRPPERPGGMVFARSFAAPFDDLRLQVEITDLPATLDAAGRFNWYLLAAAAVAVVGALIALERLTAVTVAFARRRQDFVAAVTHELKTPLTAIRLHAEMLEQGIVTDPDKRRESYETIGAEGARLSRLIEQVLALSRMERRSSRLELEIGDVAGVVDEALTALRAQAGSRGFEVVLERDDDLPAVQFHRDALLQCVLNVGENAMKFSAGSERREVAIRLLRTDGGVCLAVRDHGPGVPRAQLPHLFEDFYRGERELTRRTKGTGLGLALVRRFCELMGAAVQARNHPDGGLEVGMELRAP